MLGSLGQDQGLLVCYITLAPFYSVDGAHVLGSPTPLTMHAAEVEVTRCELAGAVIGEEARDAVAGKPERLEIKCQDAHGNDASAPFDHR